MKANGEWVGLLILALVLTLMFVAPFFGAWHASTHQKEMHLRQEIAENFASKWKRCDLAAKWDAKVRCAPGENQ